MSNLQTYRKNIDKIDKQIVSLIAKRKEQVKGVIAVKKQTGEAALQPARFDDVVRRVRTEASEQGLEPDVVEEIWRSLHNYFLQLEEKELS